MRIYLLNYFDRDKGQWVTRSYHLSLDSVDQEVMRIGGFRKADDSYCWARTGELPCGAPSNTNYLTVTTVEAK